MANLIRCMFVGVGTLCLIITIAIVLITTDIGYTPTVGVYRSIQLSARLSYISNAQGTNNDVNITSKNITEVPGTLLRLETRGGTLPTETAVNQDSNPSTVASAWGESDPFLHGEPLEHETSPKVDNSMGRILNNTTDSTTAQVYTSSDVQTTTATAQVIHLPKEEMQRLVLSHDTLRLNPISPSTVPQVDADLLALANNFHFTLPGPVGVFRPVPEVMNASWVWPLLNFLSSVDSKQITLVLANTAYQEVLLNWLISASVVTEPPIENILVVSLDRILYRMLQQKGIDTIYVEYTSILNVRYRFSRYFEQIMMIRLGFMRLINRLGYDCAMYDIDAIILKNPQPLYESYKSDIVGSRGALPKQLLKRWHVTICIGAVFIRSNPKTEQYWKAVTGVRIRKEKANDQIRLNWGLEGLGMKWKGNTYDEDSAALGTCRQNGLNVTVLPYSVVCRYGCLPQRRNQYYIWHKGGDRDKESKMTGALKGHTWFLRSDWKSTGYKSALRGGEWLRTISSQP